MILGKTERTCAQQRFHGKGPRRSQLCIIEECALAVYSCGLQGSSRGVDKGTDEAEERIKGCIVDRFRHDQQQCSRSGFFRSHFLRAFRARIHFKSLQIWILLLRQLNYAIKLIYGVLCLLKNSHTSLVDLIRLMI